MDLRTQIITWTLRKEKTANMIPFINTWPYDIVMNDLYVPECPFCKRDNVLIPIKPGEIRDIQAGLLGRSSCKIMEKRLLHP